MVPTEVAEQTTETPAAPSSTEPGKATETPAAETPAAETPATEPSAEGKPDQPKDEAAPAPEAVSYELTPPEGIEFAEGYTEGVQTLARELGLPPDKAQLIVNYDVAREQAVSKRWADQGEQWKAAETKKADRATREIHVNAVLARFPDLHGKLKEGGFLHQPELRDALASIGASWAEPSALPKGGQPSAALTPRQRAMKDFPKSSELWPPE
jgi:hypothetical protein